MMKRLPLLLAAMLGLFIPNTCNAACMEPTKIAAGEFHTCALLSGGGVQCWGRNLGGQLGNGTAGFWSGSTTPVNVTGITDAIAIAGGWEHTCALLSGGGVQCWGTNTNGQLGNGTTVNALTPVNVMGIANATDVKAGRWYACALLTGGGIKCWGQNANGQMGNGTSGGISSTPVNVTGISNAIAIAPGMEHACALLSGGAVKCWGANHVGSLGNGTFTNSLTPVDVTGISNAVAISSGEGYTCAILNGGGVQCWGNNNHGNLGNGTIGIKSPDPVDVTGISNAIALAAGNEHICAVLSGGGAQCWGWNRDGELGNGTTADASTPVNVMGISNAIALAAGYFHTCALLSGGGVRCWGDNGYGQLGNGTTTGSTTPVNEIGFPCVPAPAEICTDGIDNDGDGVLDCSDPDCFGNPVCPPNAAPILSDISVSPTPVQEGSELTLTASFTDVDWMDPHTVTVDCGGGDLDGHAVIEENVQPDSTGTIDADCAYGRSGIFTASITVSDGKGGVDTATVSVNVSNVPPVLSDILASPQPVNVGEEVTLSSSFVDLGWLNQHTPTVDCGGGSASQVLITEERVRPESSGTITAVCTFTHAGSYTVTVSVADDAGAVDVKTTAIQAVGPPVQNLADLAVDQSIWFFPGPNGYMSITLEVRYENIGTGGANGVSLEDVFTAPSGFYVADAQGGVQTPPNSNKIKWNLSTVPAGGSGVKFVRLFRNAFTPPGQLVINKVEISTPTTEATLSNNVSQRQRTFMGAFDPNAKRSAPEHAVAPTGEIEYAIDYENEGNAPASFIQVTDVLSENLDASTLTIIKGDGVYDPNTRTLTFTVENANLQPGETDYVAFRIKPAPTLTYDTVVFNRAWVVFDANPPMETPPHSILVDFEGGPENIPTLSEWATIALVGGLAFIGFYLLRKQRRAYA